MNNNVFNTQKVILNLKTQTVTLTNCCNLIMFINITVKKNVDQQRIVRSKIDFQISIEITVKIFVIYYNSLFDDKNFFFELQCR